MRLFIAIDLDDPYFSDLQKDMPGRLVKAFHLTLNFLGDVEEQRLPELKESLSKIKFNPFEITIDHLGSFPHVIWAGIEGSWGLVELQKQVESACKCVPNIRKERFHPHITLSRLKYVVPDSLKRPMKTKSFTITQFALFRSDLSKEGPRYTPLLVVKA